MMNLIIFEPMQKMRTHSLQLLLVALISLGISVNTMRITTYAHASQSFANWLSTVVKEDRNGASNLNNKLKSLENSGIELHQLIAEASVLVSQHAQAFSLPVPQNRTDRKDDKQAPNSKPDPHTIFNLLISEWNSSESHNAMREISMRKWGNTTYLFNTDNLYHDFFDDTGQTIHTFLFKFVHQSIPQLNSRWIIPFASGIAIGAP